MNREEFKTLFGEAANDGEKWDYVLRNQHLGMVVNLDNDDTFIVFPDEVENGDCWIGQFYDYIGWTDGTQMLLQSVGIKAEPV